MSEVAEAVDRLVRIEPYEVLDFATGSTVVRSGILRHDDACLVTPERGALPVFWAASGLEAFEPGITADGQESPAIGTYQFHDQNGALREGTLTGEQKRTLVARMLGTRPADTNYLVVDEVQKGGTISELTPIMRQAHGRLAIIAAQDSRPKVAAQHKNPYYTRLASNSITGIPVTVVPLPLIATDRSVLLNQLWYGGTHKAFEAAPAIESRQNTHAQLLFRALGTLVRNADFAFSPDFSTLAERLPHASPDGQLEQWVGRVVTNARARFSPTD